MSLLTLPNEILLQIAHYQALADINSLLRTNTRLSELLVTTLIDRVCRERSKRHCKEALFAAAARGDRAVVRRLVGKGVQEFVCRGAILNAAVVALEEEGLKVLLECGIEPDCRDVKRQTPFIVAARKNRPAAVRLLMLDERVNINAVEETGRTALSFAAESGHIEVVRLLLKDLEVDPNLSEEC